MPSDRSADPDQVLDYLARYTHRVAIANSRLVTLADGRISFLWKDYRYQDKPKVMTLDADEFIRRFLLHVLPDGFHRIRHYGLLASAGCKANIARARELIGAPIPQVEPPAAHDSSRSGCRDRSSPAMPLPRRPHDDCRGLWPRRRTARPALRRRDQGVIR